MIAPAAAVPRLHALANGVTVICDAAPGFETLALSVVAGRGGGHEEGGRDGWWGLLGRRRVKGGGAHPA
ncbi:MAG: M16 family metallopeptidase, partial [Caulobacteraceae bacterium]